MSFLCARPHMRHRLGRVLDQLIGQSKSLIAPIGARRPPMSPHVAPAPRWRRAGALVRPEQVAVSWRPAGEQILGRASERMAAAALSILRQTRVERRRRRSAGAIIYVHERRARLRLERASSGLRLRLIGSSGGGGGPSLPDALSRRDSRVCGRAAAAGEEEEEDERRRS